MINLKNKNLALFFTRGLSLKQWSEAGNLSREIKIYLELKKYFSEVVFFTYGAADDERYLGEFAGQFKVFPKKVNIPNWLYSLLLPWFYRKELKNIAVYKTNQMDGAWTAVIAKIFFHKKLVVRCGYEWLFTARKKQINKLLQLIYFLLEKFVYKSADVVILTSPTIINFVVENFKIAQQKILFIPNYVDTNLFCPQALSAKDSRRLICVGRLEKEKNLFFVMQALADMEAELFLYGSGSLEAQLKDFARSLKKLKVNFCGNVKNDLLPSELNKSCIFLQFSEYEGNPKTILEAMSCGVAIVASNVSGINEIINNGQDGILCEPDLNKFRIAVESLLGDQGLRDRLGAKARERIVNNFSFPIVLNKELEVYNKLLC